MSFYAADFGLDAVKATPGLTEYSAAGVVTVARSTAGIVHIGNGFFVRDFTPDASTAVLVWDANGITASEEISTSGGGGLDAAGVRAAIGLASANLDAQLDALPTAVEIRQEMDTNSTRLAAIVNYLDTEIAAILAAVDTEIGAIKTKTDGLPADTSAILTALTALVDDLEGRLTSVRAGLLDNLTNLDAAMTSRLATAGYTAPDNAGIAAIKAKTDNLPADPAGVSDVTVTGGFETADRTLLQNIEQEALGARTLNLSTGVETVSRTGRTDKTRTLYKDAAKTLPVSTGNDAVLGTGETA